MDEFLYVYDDDDVTEITHVDAAPAQEDVPAQADVPA